MKHDRRRVPMHGGLQAAIDRGPDCDCRAQTEFNCWRLNCPRRPATAAEEATKPIRQRETEKACRRLRSIVEVRVAA